MFNVAVHDTLNGSPARQKFLQHSPLKTQKAEKKFLCQIWYAMQMTGPSSSKQTKREPPADWSTDKSGAFSQLDATVFS